MKSPFEFDENKIHTEPPCPGDPPWYGPKLSYRLPTGEWLRKEVMFGYDECPDFSDEDEDEEEFDEVQSSIDFAVLDIKIEFDRRVSRLTAHDRMSWLKAGSKQANGN